MLDVALSLLALCAVALIVGAILLWRRQGLCRPVWLMFILALVMLLNLGIWTVPDQHGKSLAKEAGQ
ncbi:hypothetical protein D6851_07890 [Altericroceibacterium spongiae]|uniref:Uncharacterized protein n=1 Tax=Altericroceibacterium spongiae TaxID=2320269 RepID=A0A420EMP4_9SPHN|nr:hypothetical protein [Altericroceibacterium spongiae]RKF21923.1 hypothetical protein D6851_07890 [Altericroceibacterium spongiae]